MARYYRTSDLDKGSVSRQTRRSSSRSAKHGTCSWLVPDVGVRSRYAGISAEIVQSLNAFKMSRNRGTYLADTTGTKQDGEARFTFESPLYGLDFRGPVEKARKRRKRVRRAELRTLSGLGKLPSRVLQHSLGLRESTKGFGWLVGRRDLNSLVSRHGGRDSRLPVH